MAVTVRFWAAARTAAGVAEDEYEAPPSLAALLDAVRTRHGARLSAVLEVSSLLVGDAPVGTRTPAQIAVPDGAVVEVLPPFAGG